MNEVKLKDKSYIKAFNHLKPDSPVTKAVIIDYHNCIYIEGELFDLLAKYLTGKSYVLKFQENIKTFYWTDETNRKFSIHIETDLNAAINFCIENNISKKQS